MLLLPYKTGLTKKTQPLVIALKCQNDRPSQEPRPLEVRVFCEVGSNWIDLDDRGYANDRVADILDEIAFVLTELRRVSDG